MYVWWQREKPMTGTCAALLAALLNKEGPYQRLLVQRVQRHVGRHDDLPPERRVGQPVCVLTKIPNQINAQAAMGALVWF